jgi:hypothetical protein
MLPRSEYARGRHYSISLCAQAEEEGHLESGQEDCLTGRVQEEDEGLGMRLSLELNTIEEVDI